MEPIFLTAAKICKYAVYAKASNIFFWQYNFVPFGRILTLYKFSASIITIPA
jgi:hypothetical protein